MIYILLMLGTMLFVLLLWPTLQEPRTTAEDTRRTELEEERDQLLRGLKELQSEAADADLQTREKVRLTQVLGELDTLPAAPTPRTARAALPTALAALLGVAALTVAGAYTFLPQWRDAGMSPVQAAQLRNAARLPVLEKRAAQTKANADYLAWGDAAWDAQNYQVAARAYTQLLLKDKTNARALRRTGFFLLTTQEMADEGLNFVQQAVKLDARAPEGQLLYGYALGLYGQYEAGIKALREYQRLDPQGREADDLIVEFQAELGTAVDAKLVYTQNCAACHGPQGEGRTAAAIRGSVTLKNEAALRRLILGGGMKMPAFPQLEGAQLDALVKDLQTW